ncbi:hypothetical protein ACIOGW_35935 [Streptomyces anulatus]
MDFEPLPDGRLGFEFVNPLGPDDIDAECAQEVSNGWRAADKTWRGAEATGDPMDLAP